MDSLDEKIFQYMNTLSRPITRKEISEGLGISLANVYHSFDCLLQQEKISQIASSDTLKSGNKRAQKYYVVGQANNEQTKDLNKTYVSFLNDAQEAIENMDKKVNNVEGQTKNIYLNLISIMGVFVAIFSLIVVNTSFLSGVITKDIDMAEAIKKLFLLNMPLVASIIILLLAVRWIVILPICGTRKNQKGDNDR